MQPESEQDVSIERQSSAVRNSFVITAVTAFAIAGYFVAFWLAAPIVPDAATFDREGGSVATAALYGFYWLWGLGVCAFGGVGVVVGRGFYIAWQRR